jgi:CubicO group peptidase (beta-lactamase class C family)
MLRQEILGPLGMHETHAYIPFSNAYKLALGHKGISEVGELFYQKDGSFLKGVLGWSSTIEDMQKLLNFLLGKKVPNLEPIKPHLFKIEYAFPQNPANKLSFGLQAAPLSLQQQVSCFYQHISYQGYDHFLGIIPSVGAGLVILSNSDYSVAELAKQLLEECFK